jgi:hypothetical protein
MIMFLHNFRLESEIVVWNKKRRTRHEKVSIFAKQRG